MPATMLNEQHLKARKVMEPTEALKQFVDPNLRSAMARFCQAAEDKNTWRRDAERVEREFGAEGVPDVSCSERVPNLGTVSLSWCKDSQSIRYFNHDKDCKIEVNFAEVPLGIQRVVVKAGLLVKLAREATSELLRDS